MEHNFMKGQASIEFLLIILIGVLFITTIVIPNVESAEDRVTHLTNFAKLVISAEKLSKSIQYISLAGDGSKQTIQLIVPSNSTFECVGVSGPPPKAIIEITYDTQTTAFSNFGISPTNQCLPDPDDDTISCIKTLDPGVDFSCSTTIDPGVYIATITKDNSILPPSPQIVVDTTKISDI